MLIPNQAKRIFPFRQTDLWTNHDNKDMDILSDVGIYLNHYQFNETAAFVWRLCDKKNSAFDIAERIFSACEPDAPPMEEVTRDVIEILEDLKEKNLINWARTDRCDVLLVAPPFPLTYDIVAARVPEYSAPPIGLAYIASYLSQEGISSDIIDLHVTGSNPDDIVGICRDKEPKIIGLTANTPTFPNALRTALHIKAWNPDIPIILGGVHATGMPFDILQDGPFDYIVLGEGEVTMLELCEYLLNGDKHPMLIFFVNTGTILIGGGAKFAANGGALI